jgi:hypothetical protein
MHSDYVKEISNFNKKYLFLNVYLSVDNMSQILTIKCLYLPQLPYELVINLIRMMENILLKKINFYVFFPLGLNV